MFSSAAADTSDSEGRANLAAFLESIQQLGWITGQNLQIEQRVGANNAERMRNRDTLAAEINAVLATRTRAAWIEAFDAAGVPAGPVHSIAEAMEHPQVQARGMVVEVEHPQAGRTRAIGNPLHFSATPGRNTMPAPLLGQHSREVLRECGYSDAEIDAFVADGVIAIAR